MAGESLPISVGFDQLELMILRGCVKWLGMHASELVGKDAASLETKIQAAINDDMKYPYDVQVDMEGNEAFCATSALHLMLTDATMAKKHGAVADARVGTMRISQLGEVVPEMRGMIRRIRLEEQLAYYEHRVTDLEERLKRIEDKKS